MKLVQFVLIAFTSLFGSVNAQSLVKPSSVLHLVDTTQLPLRPPSLDITLPSTSDGEEVEAFYATLRVVTGMAQASRVQRSQKSLPGASDPLVSHDRQSFKFSFEPMVLKGAEMISIGPMGTIKKGVWTGAEQFYKLPTGGFVRLQEVDLAATGGKLYLNKGSVNADVHGAPASILTFRATDARRLEEILWTEGGRMVTLTYAPDPGQPFTAANHSALQLARSLTKR